MGIEGDGVIVEDVVFDAQKFDALRFTVAPLREAREQREQQNAGPRASPAPDQRGTDQPSTERTRGPSG